MANTFIEGKLENISCPLDYTEDSVQEFRILALSPLTYLCSSKHFTFLNLISTK